MKHNFVAISIGLFLIRVESWVQSNYYYNYFFGRSRRPTALVSLTEKLNRLLGYMKDVAGYKAQNHLPIEDVVQESKVINSSLSEAKDLGLDPESVRSFIVAQIDAAKAIQYRYHADWLAIPEVNWQPQPLDLVLQEIAVLSSQILKQLALQENNGPIQANERQSFVSQIEQHNLHCGDKMRLFDALLLVRPVVKMSMDSGAVDNENHVGGLTNVKLSVY